LNCSSRKRRLWARFTAFASPRLQIPELLALYRKGTLKLRELITRSYCLDEINGGYADLEAGKNLRGVVLF
jgi:Zn-dependent alcohol dehydrogenase